MSKYKVCVYAICKNEDKFIDRWYNSMKEADDIVVLDTGSSDNSVKLLKKYNISVYQNIITPWRFDVARNISMSYIPRDTDICVCTHLDEVFTPGWRDALEEVWNPDTTRCMYIYNWKLDSNNMPLISFYYQKIHSLNNFKWINPVHEILKYKGLESTVFSNKIILNHYPDTSKSRSSYLPLLELSIKEDKKNDRNMHYLGREYMYYKEYKKAIKTLKRHLRLKLSTWKDERCASMRFICRYYFFLGRYDLASKWFKKAIFEAPYLRDSYMKYAFFKYYTGKYKDSINLCLKALEVNNNQMTYINELFSNNLTIYDLLSICLFYCG